MGKEKEKERKEGNETRKEKGMKEKGREMEEQYKKNQIKTIIHFYYL